MRKSGNNARRRGVVLLLVLWMVIIVGLIGLAYASSVRTQLQVERFARGRGAARWAARAGIEKAKAELARLPATPLSDKDPLFDDEKTFKAQRVGTAEFSLLAPRGDEKGKPRYGLVDEASRVNINGADEEMLMRLPSMTEELAQSLLDWREQDHPARPKGAGDEYYQGQSPPYHARHAPLGTLRELMLVRGWGAVFAAARPDPYEKFYGGAASAASSDLKPEDARALLESLTVWSSDKGLAPDGRKRIDLTTGSEAEMRQRVAGLTELEAHSIIARRNSSAYQSPLDLLEVTEAPADQQGQPQGGRSDGQQQRGGGQQQGGGQQGSQQKAQKKIFDLKRVGEMIGYFAVGNDQNAKAGLININTAPREVLMALPGVEENLAAALIEARGRSPFKHAGEITALTGVTEALFKQIYPRITATSGRFHATSRGQDPETGAQVRIEAVLARTDDAVNVLYWREY